LLVDEAVGALLVLVAVDFGVEVIGKDEVDDSCVVESKQPQSRPGVSQLV